MRAPGWILFVVLALSACDNSKGGTAATASARAASPPPAASTAAPAGASAGPTPTAVTAEPPFGAITASKKEPFEAVRFRMRGEKGAEGWPEYDVANFSSRPVVFLNIYAYAYDKDGKQVGRTKPLGWSDKLEPGKQATMPIRVGRFEDKVSDSAVAFELCYTTIQFEGEKDGARDNARCPEQKPKGK
jgi:hypothetical protein